MMRLSYRLFYNNEWHEVGCYTQGGAKQLGLTGSQNTSIDISLFSREGKSVTNSLSFTLTWNAANKNMYLEVLDAILTALDDSSDIKCDVMDIDSSTTLFSGKVDLSSISITSAKIPSKIELKAKDYISELDEKINKNLVYEGYSVNSVITSLLGESGAYQKVTLNSEIAETVQLEYFVVTDDDSSTYREVIDTILFEMGGYCLYRNPNTDGYEIHQIFKTEEPSHQVHYLVSDSLKTNTSTLSNKGAIIIYPTVEEKQNARLYTGDINASFDENGNLVGEVIEPGSFYPVDGEIQATYQEFDSAYLDREYKEKRSRLQNGDIDLLYVKEDTFQLNVNPSTGFDQPAVDLIGKPSGTQLYPRKAWTLLRNNTSSAINLMSFDMTGTAVYKSKLNRLYMPPNATNPEEYETSYVFSREAATRFGEFYTNWQNLKRTTATWTEVEKMSSVGDVVVVKHKETDIGQKFIVVEQTLKFIDKNNVSYNCIGVALSGYKAYESYVDTYLQKKIAPQLSSQVDEYYYSTSMTELVGGAWASTPDPDNDGYLWKRTKYEFTNGNITYSAHYYAGGQDGEPGSAGNGIVNTIITYAISNSGVTPPTTGWQDSPPEADPGEFLWTKTLFVYLDETERPSYSVTRYGTNGTNGRGINSIVYSYALSTTNNQPADPQFTEGVKTMTSTNKYLWQKEVISYTTGDPKTTYALIGVYGDTGNTGNGISGITYYYALSTTSTQPSSITSTTLPIMTSTNKYLWQKEVISYTNGTSKTTVALIGVYGDKGADSKLIRLVADKTSFSLDSNGEPYSGQVITVSVDKQNISASHTFESDEIGVADNTEEFEITPQMMGYQPIELTNLFDFRQVVTNSTIANLPTRVSLTEFNNLTQGMTTLEKIDYLCNLAWVVRASSIATTNIRVMYFYFKVDLKNSAGASISVEVNTRNRSDMLGPTDPVILANKTYLISFYWKKNEILQKYNEGYTTISSVSMSAYFLQTDTSASSSYSMTISDSGLYNIKELLAQPKLQAMTDSDRLNWMATYLGFTAEAGSTWTIGGRATQLIDNPTFNGTTGWRWESSVTATTDNGVINLSKSNAGLTALYQYNSYKASSYYTRMNMRVNELGTWSYLLFQMRGGNNITRLFPLSVLPSAVTVGSWQELSGVAHANHASTYIQLMYSSSSSWVYGSISAREPILLDLVESGWLAQLSLMGIESDDAIKTFLDKYCPFFEGELAFPRLEEINIKVSADSHSDYLTIKASVQPRSLFLVSQPSKIELDAYGHAIEDEFKVTAHTQNIHGNLTWSNNRGLPIKAGKVQTFHASEMGLKPIELTMVGGGIGNGYYGNSASVAESNGVYTVTGTTNTGSFIVNVKEMGYDTDVIGSAYWFIRAKVKNLNASQATARPAYNGSIPIVEKISSIAQNAEGYTYALGNPFSNPTGFPLWHIRCIPSDGSNALFEVLDVTAIPVTEVLATPHLQAMTDAEKLEWLNTYIPTIGANSTWTIGGKATNLLDNPTSSDGWTCGSDVTGFSASNGIVTGTTQYTLLYASSYWMYKEVPVVAKLNDSCYVRVFAPITATAGYELGCGYNVFARNQQSGVGTIVYPDDKITVGGVDVQTTVTIDTTKGINFINLTTSGWLAQLSLMGIEGADSVKVWLDANCPFFTGEFDFPSYKDVTWTAEYEELSDTITVKTEMSVSAQPTYIKQVYAVEDLVSVTQRPDGLPLVEGDYLLAKIVESDGQTYHVPYTWNGVSWINMDSSQLPNKSEALMAMLPDVLASDSAVPEVSAFWGFFDNLVANQAFLSFLEAKNIHLTGAIYGGAYDENGNNDTGGAGFFLGKDGLFKAVKATIDDVQITGELISENFSTIATDTTVLAFTLPEDDVTYYMREKYVEQDFADFFFDRGYTGTISVSGTFRGKAFTSINLVDDYTSNGNSLSNGVLTLYRVFRTYGDLVDYDLYYTVTYGGQTFDSRQAKYIYETSISDNNDWDIIDSYKTYKATGTVMGAGVTLIGTIDNPIWVKSNDPSSIFRQFLFTQGANSVLFKVASTNAGGGYYACDIEFVESIDGILAENIYRMSETSTIGKSDEPFNEIHAKTITATTITASGNITANKVYRAVFN